MQGPLGRLAEKDIPTQRAISALFPEGKQLPGAEGRIGQAVTELAARNPTAARQLVRAHIEQTFDQVTSKLQSGPNEFGGAGFAAALRGDPQQAKNLSAAITALRGGQANQGFEKFMQVLEAQGMRQRIGSQTSFNTELMRHLKHGGTAKEFLTQLAGVGVKWPAQAKQKMQEWSLGKNVEGIAKILTDPNAAGLFRKLATEPPTSSRALAIIGHLAYLGGRSAQDATANP
jgi:hypothetical protein